MVGVPFLVSRWVSGPSLRMGCPFSCTERSQLMIGGPMKKQITMAVKTARPPRVLV